MHLPYDEGQMSPAELHESFAGLRPRLLRFARLQLRQDAAAEDAVQDALLAATENAARFNGASAAATWVFAILKNKIIDELRRRARSPIADDPNELALEEAVADLFNERDHWAEMPAAWGDPDTALEQKQFWAVFEACVEHLPERPARVFMMREFLELETDEICKELAISTSNCWVLLHRARLALRECLALHWFEPA